MANEFRVKNGLIVDEASAGAGVLTIADGDIANDDGSIAITVVDGQSVTIGKEGEHANIVVTPHNAAGELITVLNTTGTDAAAIKLNAVAGGIDVDAAKAISLTTTGAAGDISLVTAHTAGVAVHIDANANAGSIVDIDAGILDIDVTAAATIDAVGIALGAGSGELDLTTTGTMDINSAALDIDTSGAVTIDAAGIASHIALTTAHTAGVAFHLDANANAGSIVDIDAGILDIDVTAGVTLDATTMSFDGTDDSNITVTGSGKDLNIGVADGGAQELNLTSAGTGTGITVQASAGDLDLLGATGKDIRLMAGQVNVISKDDAANAIKLLADQGSSETILISNVQGTGDESIVLDAAAGGITLRADASGKRVHFHTPIIDTTQQATNMMVIDSNTTAFRISDSGNNAFITVDTSNNDVQFGSGIDLIVHDGGIIGPASASTKGIHIHSTGGVSIGSSTFIAGGTGLEVNPVNAASDYVEARLYVGVAEAAIADTLHDEDLGFLVIQNASYTGGGAGGSMGMVVTGGAAGGNGYAWGLGTARDNTSTFVLGYTPEPWDDVRGKDSSPFEVTTGSNAQELMMITATGTHYTRVGSYTSSTGTAGDHIWENASLATPLEVMRLDTSSGVGPAELKLYEGAASNNNYVGMKAQSMSANYTMILPAAKGTAGQVLDIASVSGTEITLAWDDAAGGGMDVSGTNNRMVRMHNTDDIQDTGITVDDSDNVSGMGTLGVGAITTTGQLSIAPGSTAGAAALTLTATDTDQIALDINASNIDGDVIDISADAVTTGKVIDVTADALTTGKFFKFASSSVSLADGESSILMDTAMTNDSTAAQTAFGMVIDYNKSGVTATGKTADITGFGVDLDDSATNHGSSTVNLYAGIFTADSANSQGTTKNVGLHASASGASSNYAGIFSAGNVGIGTTSPDHLLEIASSSSSQPVVAITNTHAGATSGELRFNKNSASGADSDVMGMISFYGTDDSDNTHERLAYMDAIITDSAHGSEAASLRFYVAENDATLTQGLLIAGQADDNGEVDVTIGAGSGSTTTIAGHLTITGDMNVTGDVNSVSVTNLDVDDLTVTLAKGAGSSGAADGAGIVVDIGGSNPSLLYDDTGTQWEFNKNVEFAGHILPNADDTYDIGSAALAWQDLYLEGDVTFSDAGSITTSAGGLTITPAAASTWSTGAGALTITSAAAATWSTTAGALTLTSAAAATWSTTAGILTLDGDDGIQISSTATGNIDLDSVADIVLDVADDKHVFFQEAGVTHSAIGHGTVEITDLAGASAGATAIDVFDCTTYQAVKYLIVVEDTAADHYMTTEILVLGDDNGGSAATAVMTTYAVLFNEAELGVFTVAGSGNNITLYYDPTDQTSGTDIHRVRVVAHRIASLSDSGQ
jgi:hypothetical protein